MILLPTLTLLALASASGTLVLARRRPIVPIAGDGSFAQPIVGEHHHERHLANYTGRMGPRGLRKTRAVLRLERYNWHDRQAVSVRVGGRKAGHLARADAVVFRTRYRGQGRRFSCVAVIAGRDEHGVALGVRLDIPALGAAPDRP